VTYGVQDHDNRYFVNVEIQNGAIRLSKLENDSSTVLDADSTFALSEDAWYELEIDWASDGTHTVRIYDSSRTKLGQCSATDSTWSSGGYGFDAFLASSGGTVYFDNATLSSARLLGSFESDLDGWSSSSNDTLSRVTASSPPVWVAQGDYALQVSTDGSNAPTIVNTDRFKQSNPKQYPYLIARVMTAFSNTDADVVYKYRYHRSDSSTVKESSPIQVPEASTTFVTWDLTTLSDSALENPEKIELVWYPAGYPPGTTSFDYRGVTSIDNISLTDSRHDCSCCQIRNKMRDCTLTYGKIGKTIVDNKTSTLEEGRFVYADETEIRYSFEEVGTQQYKYTIDGKVFEVGGGW
jgi:hypothetical protein